MKNNNCGGLFNFCNPCNAPCKDDMKSGRIIIRQGVPAPQGPAGPQGENCFMIKFL